ncbi:MAG: flagellar hook-basal body complex protein FliE [Pseudomonadota bacterium]|nr:flagellar hook-basal body complex protein FliE [Pseudomonadota bacterium]
MINDISSAMNAYQQALGRISNMGQLSAAKPVQQPASDFGSMVKSAIDSSAQSVQKAEAMSIAGIAGKADIQDVVMAISNAEQTLDTVVAFRDTAIKAYKEILQMTI